MLHRRLGAQRLDIETLRARIADEQNGAVRQLVAGKIAAAQNQIAELATFTGELQQATTVLERQRPDGACDSSCGCVSDPDDEPVAATRGVRLTTRPAAADEPAIACTLSADSMTGRVAEWQALRAHVDRRELIDGGVRSMFGVSARAPGRRRGDRRCRVSAVRWVPRRADPRPARSDRVGTAAGFA